MMSSFLEELQAQSGDAQSMSRNIDNLSAVIADRFRTTCQCTEQAARDLSAFEKIVDHFMNTVQTLDILYVSGRIESVRQSGAAEFGEVLGELVASVADARQRSGQLSSLVTRVQAQPLKESANQRQAAQNFA